MLPICREFYQRLGMVDEDLCLLKMNVWGKVIEVTSIVIAETLQYQRPPANTLVFSHNTRGRKSLQEYASLTYEDPAQFNGKIQVGGLKHTYGVMNEVFHYNV